MAGALTPEAVATALDRVRDRISVAGGDPDRVTIVAVTKGFGPEAVAAAAGAGLREVGENYAQELIAKAADPGLAAVGSLRWHFVGGVQRNKVKVLAPLVDLWQTVDRVPVAAEIARRVPGASVLVQVNVAGDPGRSGAPPAEVGRVVDAARDLGLDVRGLMAVAPLGPPALARAAFGSVVRLADTLGLSERSLGMSGDLETAVAAGTTMVRLGTALFGARPQR